MRYAGLQLPPDRQPEPVEKDSQLETAIEQYQNFTVGCKPILRRFNENLALFLFAKECLRATLTPAQINIFLQHIARIKDPPERRGTALSALMRNAYANGHSTFHLFVPDTCSIHNCAEYLKGTEERPYIIHVTGKLGFDSFRYTEYVTATISESVADGWGYRSKSAILYAREMKGHSLGDDAVDSTFRVHEIDLRTHPKELVFQHATNCTLQVYTRRNFEQLKLTSIPFGRENKVQLVKEETPEVIDEAVICRE